MRAGVDVIRTPNGECDVVRAEPTDADAVLGLRDEAAARLTARGIEQWRPGEIPVDWIADRIAAGYVYLVRRDGQLVAMVAITSRDRMVWGPRDDLAGYIHMLVVAPAAAGERLGRAVLSWSESWIADSGRTRARLDCVRNNPALRDYYERAGYRLVGYRDFTEPSWALDVARYERRLPDRYATLGLTKGEVALVDPAPQWDRLAARLADEIRHRLGPLVVAVEHIGSSAVPALATKPILDFAVGLTATADPAVATDALQSLGYEYRGDAGEAGGLVLVLSDRPHHRLAHLHAVRFGDRQWCRYLQFRDRLRADPATRRAYAALKRSLAARFRDDREGYTDAKSAFIERVLDADDE